jgi:hypothetical protein
MGQFEDSLADFYQHHNGKPQTGSSALDVQVGGSHYKDMKIQPAEYIMANGIGWAEGCAIKYLSRWKAKGGVEDLRKAKHFIDMVIDQEIGEPDSPPKVSIPASSEKLRKRILRTKGMCP